MKIAVCLKEVVDSKLDLGFNRITNALFDKGLAYGLNPNDSEAMAFALNVKGKNPGTEILLITIGQERVETYLRDGLALGASRAIRIWEEGFYELAAYQKSRILSRIITISGIDLVLVGSRSLDNASGLVGPFLAGYLNYPFVHGVSQFQTLDIKNKIAVVRNLSKGLNEKVIINLPVVLSIEGEGKDLPYASVDALLKSRDSSIDVLTLADLGISSRELQNDPTSIVNLVFPEPRTRPAPLDSSLPAFHRILALLQGGISRRQGQRITGTNRELVDRLFNLLIEQGVLKTAKSNETTGSKETL